MNAGTFDKIRALLGLQIVGGCNDCSAYTVLTEPTSGMFRGTVHHDTTCPTIWAIRQRERTQ